MNDDRENNIQAKADIKTVKREVVDIFQELLEQMWERLALLLGDVATMSIFQSARRESIQDHPFLGKVNVDETGVYLNDLRPELAALDRIEMRAGFLRYMDNIIDILTTLTGDILVYKVQPLVEQLEQNLEEA